MRKLFLTLFAMLSVMVANAQEQPTAPYWFVNARGGVSMPHEGDYSKIFYTVPTASISFGRMLNNQIGVRLNVNRDFPSDSQKRIDTAEPASCKKDFTFSIDGLFNFCTLFGKKDYYPLNVYMITALGYDHLGGGFQAEYNISRNLGIIAETTLNSHQVWKAELGLCYKFGHKKAKKPVVVEEPVPAPVPAVVEEPVKVEPKPEPTPAPAKKEVVKEEPIREVIFYQIRATDPSEEILDKVVAWCNKYPGKSITVDGYADAGTGTHQINVMYAQRRAAKVADALKAKGIPADRIYVKSYGDTVQPYAENDKNRCVIIVGK